MDVLFQFHQIASLCRFQEALHREQMLENKLAALQRLVQNTQEASESGWQVRIDTKPKSKTRRSILRQIENGVFLYCPIHVLPPNLNLNLRILILKDM